MRLNPESGAYLEIVFPRPYQAVEVEYRNGELVISIPFLSEASAGIAYGEMEVNVRPRVQVVEGEVVRGEQDR